MRCRICQHIDLELLTGSKTEKYIFMIYKLRKRNSLLMAVAHFRKVKSSVCGLNMVCQMLHLMCIHANFC